MRLRPRLVIALAAPGALVALAAAGMLLLPSPERALGREDADRGRGAHRQLPPAVDPWQAPVEPTVWDIAYDRFETIGCADGLPSERVTCVVAEGDDLFVGTDAGLAVRRAGVWTVTDGDDGLAHRYVTAVARDARTDTTWVATLGGLSRVSGGAVHTFTQRDSGLSNDVVYDVAVDDDLVWCATAAGACVLDTRSGSWTLYDHENSIMHEPWCYSIAIGPQRAWIGVWGGGIVEQDRRSGRWREYRDPDGEMEIDLLADDGPIHDVTAFVAYDEGLLWQATYFGVSRYDGRRWKSFTAADSGLPGDFVTHVAARGDTCWIASDQGFAVLRGGTCTSYSRNADGTCATRVVTAGTEETATTLASAPADDYVLWIYPREDDVWIATGRGLTHGLTTPPEPSSPRRER